MGFLSSISQKIALAVMVFLAPIAGVPAPSLPPTFTTAAIPSGAQTAMVESVVMPSSTVATVVVVIPSIESNLLPTVHLAKHPIVLKPTPKKIVPVIVASTTVKTTVVTQKPAIIKPAASSTPIPTEVTPQWIFDRTVSTLAQQRDGTWRAVLSTKISTTQTITWHLTDTSLPGSSISPFNVSYVCDPPTDIPDPASFDQNLIFRIRTAYSCTVTLTPLTGTDRRAQSKTFLLQTGSGQLMVTPPAAMNTVLKNDQNDGGFVFTNQDGQPVTVTGVTVDVSYAGLSNTDGSLVMRFADPATGQSLFDYHLENLPTDPARPFTLSKTGVQVPLTLEIPANGHKMLIVRILGVHKMSVLGLDPAVTVTLRQVALSQPDIKTVLATPQISWNCVLPTTGYDPNATSGAYATGQVCKD